MFRTNGARPNLNLRFSDCDGIANFGRHILTDTTNRFFGNLGLMDSSFNAGYADFIGSSGDFHGVTNNVFLRVDATFKGTADVEFWNNYAFGSPSFKFLSGGGIDWYVRDNFFQDGVYTNTLPGDSTWKIGYNAYLDVPVGSRLTQAQPSDIIMGSQFAFVSGPFGDYYHNNTTLVNQGRQRSYGHASGRSDK